MISIKVANNRKGHTSVKKLGKERSFGDRTVSLESSPWYLGDGKARSRLWEAGTETWPREVFQVGLQITKTTITIN